MDNLISIIIPAYNLEHCLANTLDSILAQTWQNIEIIVVNDGSCDGTGAVIDSYAARCPRLKAIHKENGGVTSARLRGVAEASGHWIGFVDGDDYCEPHMYQRLLENALKHDAAISHCGYQMVFPDGHVDYYYNTGRILDQPGIQGCYDLLTGAFVEPGLVNKLYRRDLFATLPGQMNPDIRINEDLLMNYLLFKQARLAVFEDICPYHYILRRGSAATAKLNAHKLLDPLKVTHIILSDLEEALIPALMPRLTRQLIAGATMDVRPHPELIVPHRAATRRELRQRLFTILKGSGCSPKLKVMALWAALWPASYGLVHRVYARISGVDKKFDIT